MEPTSFFSGLLSGLDYRGLVDAIINAEARPLNVLENRITTIEARSSVFVSYEGMLTGLRDASSKLGDRSIFDGRTITGGDGLVSASATQGADLGSHSVRVLQKAQAERLGGAAFGSDDQGLNLSGEFFVGGQRVAVAVADSLDDVAASINQANTGPNASGVSASVISVGGSDHRLVLSTNKTGAQGINLVDGSSGLLKNLGFLDASVDIKNQTSDGAQSDAFANATQSLATLRGLQNAPGPQTVTIGGFNATLDLSTMSLTDIANEINAQAGIAGSGVSAAVVADTSGDATRYRLDVSGTTSFVDAGGSLELLGLLEGGRGDIAHEAQSANVLQQSNGSTPATAGTTLASLAVNGTAAGMQVGDTLDLSGTRGDGSAFSFTYTVGAGDSLQDVLDQLNNSTDGLQSGSRTATASIGTDGRLVLTDDATGDSRLSLSVVANNEGGGTFDLGTVGTTVVGRNRVITAGQDAQLEVDGVFLQRTTNAVDDAVEGLTLNLLSANAGQTTTVTVGRDDAASVDAIEAFVTAYNAAANFVTEQVASPGEGEPRGPLAGDTTMRSMAAQMRNAMRASIAPGIAGNLTRLLDIGIELQQDGTFELDKTALSAALTTDPTSVERLFGLYGKGSVSELEYVNAQDATVAGDYSVNVTQAATRALLAGTGFSGVYADDGTPDSILIRDVSSNANYSVALNNGDTLQTIVDRINAEFATELQESHQSSAALYSDAVGTPASDSTLLQDLFDGGGSNMGTSTFDVITIAGTQRGGTSFSYDFQVNNPAAQTVGDLLAAVRTQVGADTDVTLDANGVLNATDRTTGSSLFTLSITSDNAGGGSFSMGTIAATQEGRSRAALTAVDNGGQLELAATEYGSAQGFEISYAAGGADGSAQLGLAAGVYNGLDVTGTIGGFVATGIGQLLTGDPGSSVEGLSIRYSGATIGAVGSFGFSRGIASQVELAVAGLVDSGGGSIDSVVEQSATRVTSLENRLDVLNTRLDRRRTLLLNRFIAAETAMAQYQGQYTSLLGSLTTGNGNQDG